ncbi:MAG: hypothetical protein K2G36_05170 [Ruminococcus sp.]|nr:hypothetical protein [Ruminococcus sp.]
MKKLLKIIFPAVLMVTLIFLLQGGKSILSGLYFYFPVIYFLNGLTTHSTKELTISLLLLSVAFLIPVYLWFNMGTCIDMAIVYAVLSCMGFLTGKKLRSKMKKVIQ